MKAPTMKRSMQTAITCILFGCATAATASVTTFPYTSGFEGAGEVLGNMPTGTVWTKTGTGTANVSNNTAAADSKSVCINDAALTLNVDSAANGTNMRVRLFCKPYAYDNGSADPEIGTGSRAVFFLTTGGVIRARNGTGWTNLVSGLSTNQWYGFIVTLDYTRGLWDLYYTNGQYVAGSGMTKLNGNPLLMVAGANSALTNVTVSSGNSAYVDEFAVDRGYTVLVAGTPSQSAVQYVASLNLQPSMLAREITRYFDSTCDGLDQELGAALARALSGDPNAKLHVYFPSQGGMSVYNVVLGAWNRDTGSGPLPAGVRLSRTTGFWIETTLSGLRTVDALVPPSTAALSDVTLSGAWNMLAWPYADRGVNNGVNDNTGLPTSGLIYIYRPGQSWLTLRFKSGVGWTSGRGTTTSMQELQKEQSFWFLGGGNWDL